MILKQALRNFSQNKIKTTAIIVTVALCCVMLFFSLIYSQIIKEEFHESIPVEAQNSEIRIEYTPKSRTRIINVSFLEEYMEDIEFAAGVLDIYGVANINRETHYINLRGISYENLNDINDLKYIEEENKPKPAQDDIIISEKTAQRLNLGLGNSIRIKVENEEKTFYVTKIAQDHPCFERAGVFVIYGMEKYVSGYFPGGGFGNFYNKIHIKTKPHVNNKEFMERISKIPEYSGYEVKSETDTETYDQTARDIALPLTIAGMGCVGMVMILIYLIVNSDLKKKTLLISQLKSVGADNRYIFSILALEGLIYIIIGVVLGVLSNLFLLYRVLPQHMNFDVGNSVYLIRLVLSAIFNAALVFVLFIFPIYKSKHVSIRKSFVISKNTLWKGKKIVFIVGILMLVVSVFLVIPKQLNEIRGIFAFILVFFGIVIILPYAAKGVAYLFEKFANTTIPFISFRNIQQEKTVANNLRILFSAIIVCSIIISATSLTSDLTYQIVSDVDCDIIIQNVKGESEYQKNKVIQTEGVYDVYSYFYKKTEMSRGDESINVNIIGINRDDFDFMKNTGDLTSKEELLGNLDEKDGMLVDYMYHKVYGIDIGDKLTIAINDITHEIEVKNFYNSYQYGGSTVTINNQLLNELYDIPLYNTIVLKTRNDINETVMILRAKLGVQNVIVLNKFSVFEIYIDILENSIDFAYLFAALIIIVCLFGVFTNIINSREQRKLTYYQLYSLGVNKEKIVLIELIENIFVAVFCGIFVMLSHYIFSLSVTNALAISKIYIPRPI
ncbi:MAG: FtsX-like permease family protein, partial [Bacillota bacterium]